MAPFPELYDVSRETDAGGIAAHRKNQPRNISTDSRAHCTRERAHAANSTQQHSYAQNGGSKSSQAQQARLSRQQLPRVRRASRQPNAGERNPETRKAIEIALIEDAEREGIENRHSWQSGTVTLRSSGTASFKTCVPMDANIAWPNAISEGRRESGGACANARASATSKIAATTADSRRRKTIPRPTVNTQAPSRRAALARSPQGDHANG